MERLRIEIRSGRPLDRAEGAIDLNAVEQTEVTQRPKQLSLQNWAEVDGLLGAVVEMQGQSISTNDFEPLDSIDGVPRDGAPLLQWVNLAGSLAG